MSPLPITGNFYGGFYFRDTGPVGVATIALLARARMQRDGLEAAILGQPRHADVYQFAIVPSGAEFHGERNGDGGAYGSQQALDQGQIAQQTRAAIAGDYFLDRASEVDVDDIEAHVLAVARGVRHHLRIGSE